MAECVDAYAIVSEWTFAWVLYSLKMNSGPRFRKHRRFIQQTFNQRAAAAFHPLQEKETLVMLDGLLQAPGAFIQHIRRYVERLCGSVTVP
jgi:cytochrome P450